MDPLTWLHKRRAIRRYLRVLPFKLRDDYGHLGPYSPGQVQRTVERHKITGPRFLPYALAIFCDPGKVDAGHLKELERLDLGRLRDEIAVGWFEGNAEFDLKDVFSQAAEHSAGAGSGDHGGHSGMDHGVGHAGDGGGGH
jgi:hypothetical protein